MLHSLKSKTLVTLISVFLLLIVVYLIFSSPAKTWQLPSSSEVIAFSPNGEMLATASGALIRNQIGILNALGHQNVEIRKVTDGSVIQTIDFFSASSLAFSPDNSQIAVGGYRGKVEIHRISDGKLVRDFKINDLPTDRPTSLTNFLAFINDGQTLVAGTTGFPGRMTLWSLKNDKQLYTILDDYKSLAVSTDGKFLAFSTQMKPLALYQVSNNIPPRQIETINKGCNDAKFSLDGQMLVILDLVSNVDVFSTQNNNLLQFQSISLEPFENKEHPNQIAISPDNRYVAVSFTVLRESDIFLPSLSYFRTSHGRIRIWDVKTGRLVATLRGHTKGTNTIAFSPDGKWLASAGKDNTIKFWRMPPKNYAWLWLLSASGLATLGYWQRAYLMHWLTW